jgi:hypothetical protein
MQATSPRSSFATAARSKAQLPIDGLALALCGVLLCWGPVGRASAQPLGWSVYHPDDPREASSLSVINLATSAQEAMVVAPPGVTLHGGALTPDGQYYLAPTSHGIARFRTDPIGFDRLSGPSSGVDSLTISPTGTRVHALGTFGHAVVDWETGDVLTTDCCERIGQVSFTPDGAIRLQVTLRAFGFYTLTAISELTAAVLWTRDLDYHYIDLTVSNSRVAVYTDYSDILAVIMLDVANGAELAQRNGFGPWMAWRGGELLTAYIHYPAPPDHSTRRLRLSVLDDRLENERVLLERDPAYYNSGPGGIVLSHDARHAYWLTYGSADPSRINSAYEVFDLDANVVIGSGVLGEGYRTLSIDASDRCVLGVPASVAGPVEGGSVGIPVVPAANCRPWSVVGQPAVLNAGPHAGPATVFVQTWANALATEKTTPVSIGGQAVLVTQPSGVPTAPTLDAAVVGDRVALSWTPAIGGGIASFVVRGAVAGSSVMDVLTLPGHLRTWASPPLPPGSYQVELVAANGAGRSGASNRRSFSIGLGGTPGPPTNLVANVADDRVALSWTPASTEPAAGGFIIEAASGAGAFAAVARSDSPSFVATRVPAGSWQVRVRATTAGGVSRPSDVVTVTTAPCTAPPAPPQLPWALWTPPAVTLRWSPPPSGSVDDYVIEVGTASGRSDLGRLVVGAPACRIRSRCRRWRRSRGCARATPAVRARRRLRCRSFSTKQAALPCLPFVLADRQSGQPNPCFGNPVTGTTGCAMCVRAVRRHGGESWQESLLCPLRSLQRSRC